MAAASPPTDLAANFEGADPLARGNLSAYIVRSWNRAYGAPMAAVADKRTVGIIERATSGCVGNKVRLPQLIRLFALKGRMGRVDLTAAQPWADLVRRNSPDPAALTVPHLVVSSRGDKLVNDGVTRDFVRRACAAGKAVRLEETAEPDHSLTASASAPAAMRWIADRFAGRPAPGCSGV